MKVVALLMLHPPVLQIGIRFVDLIELKLFIVALLVITYCVHIKTVTINSGGIEDGIVESHYVAEKCYY